MRKGWVRRWARTAWQLAASAEARQDALYEWRRRRSGEPPLPDATIRRVLVVCHGNICRSPFAAALISRRRRDVEVRSAGLAAGEGAAIHETALRAARSFGVDLGPHRAHLLEEGDVSWAELILAMEGHQAAHVAKRWPFSTPRIRLLGDFLPGPPFRIGDPFGQGDAVFTAAFERIELAVERLIARLEAAGAGPA